MKPKLIITTLALSLFGVSATHAEAWVETPAKIQVLAIGIDHYQDEELPKLANAAKDAQDIVEYFSNRENVEVTSLINEQASLAAVKEKLALLIETSGYKDTTILYFSGLSSSPQNEFGLLLHDTVVDTKDKATLVSDELSATNLLDFSKKLKGRLLVIVDSAFSGRLTAEFVSAGLDNEIPVQSRVVLAASMPNQFALDGINNRSSNSPFTSVLLEGLVKERAADTEGKITVLDLANWISKRMEVVIPNHQQTPFFFIYGEDFQLAPNIEPAPTYNNNSDPLVR